MSSDIFTDEEISIGTRIERLQSLLVKLVCLLFFLSIVLTVFTTSSFFETFLWVLNSFIFYSLVIVAIRRKSVLGIGAYMVISFFLLLVSIFLTSIIMVLTIRGHELEKLGLKEHANPVLFLIVYGLTAIFTVVLKMMMLSLSMKLRRLIRIEKSEPADILIEEGPKLREEGEIFSPNQVGSQPFKEDEIDWDRNYFGEAYFTPQTYPPPYYTTNDYYTYSVMTSMGNQ